MSLESYTKPEILLTPRVCMWWDCIFTHSYTYLYRYIHRDM